MDFTKYIEKVDREVAEIIKHEVKRNRETLLMIASENYADEAILQAQGSVFTNKYAEGYPGKRFYQGVGNSDDIEQLAIDRAKKLFGAEHANVQPHSGSQTNQAVYLAVLKPGDSLLGMNLAAGGHLTHGAPASSSGKLYQAHSYGVNKDTFLLDYDEILKTAQEVKPKIIVAGASAYPRAIDFKKFREIADSVGALLLADMAHYAGLVAAKLYPDPVPYCDFVTTTTHKTLRGPRGGRFSQDEPRGHGSAIIDRELTGLRPLHRHVGRRASETELTSVQMRPATRPNRSGTFTVSSSNIFSRTS